MSKAELPLEAAGGSMRDEWIALLNTLCRRWRDVAVWKNADAGLEGSGDIDLLAPEERWSAIQREFELWADDRALGTVVACRHIPGALFLFAVVPGDGTMLQLDIRSHVSFFGSVLFDPRAVEDLMRWDDRGFRRLRPGAEGLFKLIVHGFSKKGLPRPQGLVKEDVARLLRSDPEGVRDAASLFGFGAGPLVDAADALVAGGWNRRAVLLFESRCAWRAMGEPRTARAGLRARRAKRTCPVLLTSIKGGRRVEGDIGEWIDRARIDHGVHGAAGPAPARPGVLSVVGPDGVGKSTLIDGLLGGVLAERPVLNIRNVSILPRRSGEGGVPVTEPHKDPPYALPLSLAKTAYVTLDYVLGWFMRVRPFQKRGGWVLIQRGWWDMAVDPKRYRLGVSSGLLWRLGRTFPCPDIVLVLEAPAEIVHARKAELPIDELDRQSAAWREKLPRKQRRVYLDATRRPEEIIEQAAEEIRRLSSPSKAGTVGLPRPGAARWVIPRGPSSAVSAGLRVYHPVTTRGVIGWGAASLAAKAGGFRVLRRGGAIPPEIEDRLRPWMTPGGSIALARTNHPGRTVALLIDDAGACTAIAKLGSGDEGRATLAAEAENIERLGPLLPAPLSAPSVVAHEDGMLVLGYVPWVPRWRSWRLPVEAAASMGAFWASRTDDGSTGLTHGDLAPWNLFKTGSGWVLLDWEEARAGGPPFYDLLHYLVQGHALLGHPSESALLSGIRGAGWVGRAVDAYAEASGADRAELPASFATYLHESRSMLDPSTNDGQAGLAARRRLAARLGAGP